MAWVHIGNGFKAKEEDIIRLFNYFRPYYRKYGLELGFQRFYDKNTKFCLDSGLEAVETTILGSWKGKQGYTRFTTSRYIPRRHTTAEWEQRKADFNHECAYCGSQENLTKDHVIPISKGGSDKIDNIVPACWLCNYRKRAKDLRTFQVESHGVNVKTYNGVDRA